MTSIVFVLTLLKSGLKLENKPPPQTKQFTKTAKTTK